MLASRSAIASDSSAKAGSNALSGNDASPLTLSRAESRNEDRDEGRSGVVGRDERVRELDRFAPESPLSAPEDMACSGELVSPGYSKCAVVLVSPCRASVLSASWAKVERTAPHTDK